MESEQMDSECIENGRMEAAGESYKREMSPRFVASVVAVGILSFAGVVVETAMNVAFPALMSEFGVQTSTVQWITTAYLLVLSVLVPASAFFKKRFLMKRLFAAASILFAAGTVMCMLAPVFGMLVAGRVVQGVGTAVALPLMFNIVIEQAPKKNMGMMMGVATLITAMAPAVGPSIGGLLVESFGWRSVFAALLPLLICSFVIGMLTIRQSSKVEKTHMAVGQMALLGVSFASLIFATTYASTSGWISAPVLVLLAIFACCLVLFCVSALRSDNPLIDIRVFSHAPFAWSVVYILLIQGLVLALGYLIPNFAQIVNGTDAFIAGCLLLPGCIVGAVMAPFGGNILDKLGAAKPIFTGAIFQVAAIALFCIFGLGSNVMVLALIYVLVPIAQGLSVSNSITNGLSYLPSRQQADGNAAFNTVQQLGGAIGTAVTTTIVNAAQTTGANFAVATATGVGNAFLMLMGVSVVILVCAVMALTSGKREKVAAGEKAQAHVE